jgi:hypothetical protein
MFDDDDDGYDRETGYEGYDFGDGRIGFHEDNKDDDIPDDIPDDIGLGPGVLDDSGYYDGT